MIYHTSLLFSPSSPWFPAPCWLTVACQTTGENGVPDTLYISKETNTSVTIEAGLPPIPSKFVSKIESKLGNLWIWLNYIVTPR